eukprot:1453012-Prymnesium_polylepis.1
MELEKPERGIDSERTFVGVVCAKGTRGHTSTRTHALICRGAQVLLEAGWATRAVCVLWARASSFACLLLRLLRP